MYSLLFLGVVSFALALFLTPSVRNVFWRLGVVDQPDHERKLHKSPVVRVGGIAIALSYMLAFALLLLVKLRAGVIVWGAFPIIWKVFPAALLIFGTGLLDDLIDLRPWQKLSGQVAASVVAYLGGIQIVTVNGKGFVHWWSFPLTVGWLLLSSNALNLIDGVDGLAAGIGLFATVTMTLAALMQHNVVLGLATVPLAGCLLGFLRYNFNPATIFLGDCGSLLIGFLLGCYGVLWSEKSATILGMAAPLLALSIPLIDTALAIVRRFLQRRPLFRADRGHIHHRLLERGLTPRRVALLLYAICLFASLFALSLLNHRYEIPVLIGFCVAACFGITQLRFIEFETIVRMASDGAFRGLLNMQIALHNFEVRLSIAASPDECWAVLKNSYRQFGFSEVSMQFAGNLYKDGAHRPEELVYSIDIPLSFYDYVRLIRDSDGIAGQTPTVSFAEVVGKLLGSKLAIESVRVPISASDTEEIEGAPESWQAASPN